MNFHRFSTIINQQGSSHCSSGKKAPHLFGFFCWPRALEPFLEPKSPTAKGRNWWTSSRGAQWPADRCYEEVSGEKEKGFRCKIQIVYLISKVDIQCQFKWSLYNKDRNISNDIWYVLICHNLEKMVCTSHPWAHKTLTESWTRFGSSQTAVKWWFHRGFHGI